MLPAVSKIGKRSLRGFLDCLVGVYILNFKTNISRI